jgi:hypothetical protein
MELTSKLNLKTTDNTVDKKLILNIGSTIRKMGIEVLNTRKSKAFRFGDSLIISVCDFVRERNAGNNKLPNPYDVLFETSIEEVLAIVNDYSSKAITVNQLKCLIVAGVVVVKNTPDGRLPPELEKINMDNILNVPDLIDIRLLRYDAENNEKAMIVIDKKLAIMFLKEK